MIWCLSGNRASLLVCVHSFVALRRPPREVVFFRPAQQAWRGQLTLFYLDTRAMRKQGHAPLPSLPKILRCSVAVSVPFGSQRTRVVRRGRMGG